MSLQLHGYWRSSASYRVRIALNLKGLEYEYIPVHLVKSGGEQFSEYYQSVNPNGLVPTFIDQDEDIVLNQSLAIIEYLEGKYPTPPILPVNDDVQKARVRALAMDLACDVQPLANLRVLQHLEQQYKVEPIDKSEWAKHWISLGLKAVEKRIQNTAADFCFGFDVTMADIVLVPQVYNAQRFSVDMSQFPLIERIVQNCQQLDAFKLALPENQIDAE